MQPKAMKSVVALQEISGVSRNGNNDIAPHTEMPLQTLQVK
jgi:hypothetical protein